MRSLAVAIRTNMVSFNTRYRYNDLRLYGTACWNCKKHVEPKKNMICTDCGHLQDVDVGVNYFDLMKFPATFSMESQELTQRFRQLQTQVHPDKYSNKTTREQSNSADWSSLINKAYKTLSTPVERGQYLLQLYGEQMPQDNSALNKEFLMSMMERNEEVEDADDKVSLESLNAQIVDELNENTHKLVKLFEKKELAAVKATLVEMKYLLSIQNSIKQKLERVMARTEN